MAPVWPQLGLRADQPGAPDDHALAGERCLGDLCLPAGGVVGERRPSRLGDTRDPLNHALLAANADRVAPPGVLEALHQRVVPERRVGA